MDSSKLWAMAIGGILSQSPTAMAIVAEQAEAERLMLQARAVTGRTELEIRAAAARSLLCFADFVRALQYGITSIDSEQ